jgi:hypothetical protein
MELRSLARTFDEFDLDFEIENSRKLESEPWRAQERA